MTASFSDIFFCLSEQIWYNWLLLGMTILAVVVFIALHFIRAGYGMMYTKQWGCAIDNRIGWILMESPVFFAMLLMWSLSERRTELVPTVFLCIFELHYFQRSFIFPMLMRGRNVMPISIILSGVTFNLLNALIQGGWIFYLSPRYPDDWLSSLPFIIGIAIFFIGMYINLQSDYIVRHLRQPGDTRHYIPRGGMFAYVSSANYFGELLEWIGFTILTCSLSGAVFAIWTFANLAPRAKKINERYAEEFGEEFTRLHLKSIIPFIY